MEFVEIRMKLLEHGVDPVPTRDCWARFVKFRRRNFEEIRPLLSKQDAIHIEISIIRDEYLLQLLRNACI